MISICVCVVGTDVFEGFVEGGEFLEGELDNVGVPLGDLVVVVGSVGERGLDGFFEEPVYFLAYESLLLNAE